MIGVFALVIAICASGKNDVYEASVSIRRNCLRWFHWPQSDDEEVHADGPITRCCDDLLAMICHDTTCCLGKSAGTAHRTRPEQGNLEAPCPVPEPMPPMLVSQENLSLGKTKASAKGGHEATRAAWLKRNSGISSTLPYRYLGSACVG